MKNETVVPLTTLLPSYNVNSLEEQISMESLILSENLGWKKGGIVMVRKDAFNKYMSTPPKKTEKSKKPNPGPYLGLIAKRKKGNKTLIKKIEDMRFTIAIQIDPIRKLFYQNKLSELRNKLEYSEKEIKRVEGLLEKMLINMV